MKIKTFAKFSILIVLAAFMVSSSTVQAMEEVSKKEQRKRNKKKKRRRILPFKSKSAGGLRDKKSRKKITPKETSSDGSLKTARGGEYHAALSGSCELSLAPTWEAFVKGFEEDLADSSNTKEDLSKARKILRQLSSELRECLTTKYSTTKKLENAISLKAFSLDQILKGLQYALLTKKEALFIALSKTIPSMMSLISIKDKMPKKYNLPKRFEEKDGEDHRVVSHLYATAILAKRKNTTIQTLQDYYRKEIYDRYMSKFKPLCKDIVFFGVTTGQFYLVLSFIDRLSKRGFSIAFLDELPKDTSDSLNIFIKQLFDNIYIHDATVMLSECIENMPERYINEAENIIKKYSKSSDCRALLDLPQDDEDVDAEVEELGGKLEVIGLNHDSETSKLFKCAQCLDTDLLKSLLSNKLLNIYQKDEYKNNFLHVALGNKVSDVTALVQFVNNVLDTSFLTRFKKTKLFFEENRDFQTPLHLLFLRIIESSSFEEFESFTKVVLKLYKLRPSSFFPLVQRCTKNPYFIKNNEKATILHTFASKVPRDNHASYKWFTSDVFVLFPGEDSEIKLPMNQKSWSQTPLEVYQDRCYNLKNKPNKKLIKFFSSSL